MKDSTNDCWPRQDEPDVDAPLGEARVYGIGAKRDSAQKQSPTAKLGRCTEDVVLNALQTDQPQPDFVVPGLEVGTYSIVYAPGKTGKSFWALELCASVAYEEANQALLQLEVERYGAPQLLLPVVYIALEDSLAEVKRRVRAIGRRLSVKAQTRLAGALKIESLVGEGFALTDRAWLRAVGERYSGARLITIDTLSKAHSLDEDGTAEAGEIVAGAIWLARRTGAAVLVVHHTRKSLDAHGQHSSRGNLRFVSDARWAATMRAPSAEEIKNGGIGRDWVLLDVGQVNYAAPWSQWYRRGEDGILVPASLATATARGRSSCAAKARRRAV